MFGFMDLMWRRVFRRSNVSLVIHLLCRDSDTLRKPKKSSSTGRVALKCFNRFFFSVHNIRCRS